MSIICNVNLLVSNAQLILVVATFCAGEKINSELSATQRELILFQLVLFLLNGNREYVEMSKAKVPKGSTKDCKASLLDDVANRIWCTSNEQKIVQAVYLNCQNFCSVFRFNFALNNNLKC